jgi:hypothetical protein
MTLPMIRSRSRSLAPPPAAARALLVGLLGGLIAVAMGPFSAVAEPAVAGAVATRSTPAWQLTSERETDGFAWSLYEEVDAKPGRPAFRVEADLEASPALAAETLMASLADPGPATTAGERRQLLERTTHGALVHTFIDLPFMFSDREIAIRIEHSREDETGIHRVRWRDANEVLPPPIDGVLRLGSDGFWEFHPTAGGSHAIYVSRAEVGGSLPRALQDRLMRGQAVDSVLRLRGLVARRLAAGKVDVAASPPEPGERP